MEMWNEGIQKVMACRTEEIMGAASRNCNHALRFQDDKGYNVTSFFDDQTGVGFIFYCFETVALP
jgi:hypothetical protein